MAGLQSPALTGSPNSTAEHNQVSSRSPSFEVPSPSAYLRKDAAAASARTQDPSISRIINMNNASGSSSGSSGGSYQGSTGQGAKKDDGILDAFLPRIESRGQSRQVAPKKDDTKSKGQSNP